MHRLLVCALAAWMTLCCCEKRILADCLGETPAASSCCGGSCCAEPEQPDEPREAPVDDHATCCADGCCTKAAPDAPSWSLGLDLIGVPQLPLLASPGREARCMHEPPYEDLTAGEPPPRLALIISRRLRI